MNKKTTNNRSEWKKQHQQFSCLIYVVSLAATQECQHGVFRRKLPIHIYNSSEGEHVDVGQSEKIKSIASSSSEGTV